MRALDDDAGAQAIADRAQSKANYCHEKDNTVQNLREMQLAGLEPAASCHSGGGYSEAATT